MVKLLNWNPMEKCFPVHPPSIPHGVLVAVLFTLVGPLWGVSIQKKPDAFDLHLFRTEVCFLVIDRIILQLWFKVNLQPVYFFWQICTLVVTKTKSQCKLLHQDFLGEKIHKSHHILRLKKIKVAIFR
jgi:hypothetical protein